MIDMENNFSITKKPNAAKRVIMNPESKILAL